MVASSRQASDPGAKHGRVRQAGSMAQPHVPGNRAWAGCEPALWLGLKATVARWSGGKAAPSHSTRGIPRVAHVCLGSSGPAWLCHCSGNHACPCRRLWLRVRWEDHWQVMPAPAPGTVGALPCGFGPPRGASPGLLTAAGGHESPAALILPGMSSVGPGPSERHLSC